jgi:folate-binding Fe-S cluster repair protein YgfZ
MLQSSTSTIDFDYDPPNRRAVDYQTDLPSSFPPGTPAGLRGEAVRSALRSGRCITWSFTETKALSHGLLSVQGRGCRDFLENKLSQSFPNPAAADGRYGPTDQEKLACFAEAALLTARGRMVDRVGVAWASDDTAHVQTSPGHAATALFQRLDAYVFPLDEVELAVVDPIFGFTLASVKRQDVVDAFENFICPALALSTSPSPSLPANNQSLWVTDQILVFPTVSLPGCAAVGYTFWFINEGATQGRSLWKDLTSDAASARAPVVVGALEWESLRIQAGMPGYGWEMTGHVEKEVHVPTPATPLEFPDGAALVNTSKGCYMGQEGIASVLKNQRGPPRLLYQVVFSDNVNLYDSESFGEALSSTPVENLTRRPVPGDVLYVLGSNEEIQVGRLTSVAEPGSTGDTNTVALALVRRVDSILQAMKKADLEMPARVYDIAEQEGSAMIQPPPLLDPLDGVEVILQGTFTVGTLRSLPSPKFSDGRSTLFAPEDRVRDLPWEKGDGSYVDVTRVPLAGGLMSGDLYEPRQGRPSAEAMLKPLQGQEVHDAVAAWEEDEGKSSPDISTEDEDDEAALEQALKEAKEAQAAAEAAAAEASRKAAKMEMLQQRAREALARRQAKKALDE